MATKRQLIIKEYRNFPYGVINNIEARSIPAGSASDSQNWITMGDKIELRRGTLLLGTEVAGSGRVTGLHRTYKSDGTQILYKTYLSKLKYYDTVTEDWIEVGTNQLGTAASGEDITFANYSSLAGYQMYLCSPNSSFYKIMTVNPGSIVDVYVAARGHKGWITMKENRTFLWNRRDNTTLNYDKSGMYLSYIDDAAGYTTVSAEAYGTGDATTKTFTHTLAVISGQKTAFGVTVTDSTETFTDNYDGTLTGSLGGTGTINYATGACSVTFKTAPGGAVPITCTYQHEDQSTGGLADFSYGGTRTAGQGDIIRQDVGGDIRNVFAIENTEYVLHQSSIYALTLTADDTGATNFLHRENTGMPNIGAGVATGDGVYYIDDSDENDPRIRLMTYQDTSSKVIPQAISLNLNLSGYRFNKAEMTEWGDYIIASCRTKDETENDTMLFYNKIWKSWDIVQAYCHKLAVYNGVLHIGDSGSNNVYEFFSGLDDDDSTIGNYWTSWESDLEIRGLKKVKRLIIHGAIGADQEIEVSMSYDGGNFASIGTIRGDGSYVDTSQSIDVGAMTIGRAEVGGGGGDGAIPAHNYMREFKLRSDKFERCRIKFVANNIGYASVSTIRFKDVRLKGDKIPSRYRTTT
jgi:hypothetical protein